MANGNDTLRLDIANFILKSNGVRLFQLVNQFCDVAETIDNGDFRDNYHGKASELAPGEGQIYLIRLSEISALRRLVRVVAFLRGNELVEVSDGRQIHGPQSERTTFFKLHPDYNDRFLITDRWANTLAGEYHDSIFFGTEQLEVFVHNGGRTQQEEELRRERRNRRFAQAATIAIAVVSVLASIYQIMTNSTERQVKILNPVDTIIVRGPASTSAESDTVGAFQPD